MFFAEIFLFGCGGPRDSEDMRKPSAEDPGRQGPKAGGGEVTTADFVASRPGKADTLVWAVARDERRGLPDYRQPGSIGQYRSRSRGRDHALTQNSYSTRPSRGPDVCHQSHKEKPREPINKKRDVLLMGRRKWRYTRSTRERPVLPSQSETNTRSARTLRPAPEKTPR